MEDLGDKARTLKLWSVIPVKKKQV
jgi:hypothetical protein